MIIYNVETSTRMNFSSAHFPTLSLGFEGIPAVLISNEDGLALKRQYTYSNGFYIVVTPDFPQNLFAYLLPFAVVIGICLLIMISFMVIKCVRDRQKSRRHRLSNKHLKKLPTTKFKKGLYLHRDFMVLIMVLIYSAGDHYDTCAICLEEYVDGEKLRVLPCGHGKVLLELFLSNILCLSIPS